MSVVVDSSVFVAASRISEPQYAASEAFLSALASSGQTVRCPTLVLPECAAAVARGTGDPAAARAFVNQLANAFSLELVPLTVQSAQGAVNAAIQCRTRGADSCYIEVAVETGSTLVTWDREMLVRGAQLVQTVTPEQWLAQQTGPGT